MTVRVYTGYGTSRTGSPLMVEELARAGIDVHAIEHNEMRAGQQWKKETSMLIFAGQSVRKFKEALGEDVLREIQRLVFEGAIDYTGACAGAALGSADIKYRVKEIKYRPSEGPVWQVEKIQNTGLGFFNGLATGPCRSVSKLPFSGQSENLHLIALRSATSSKNYHAFHWGGPALIATGKHEQGRILSYLESDRTAMSCRLKYGQGNVTLYSFHPEINAQNVLRWANVQHMDKEIRVEETRRLEFLASKLDGTAFSHFLEETGLKLRAPAPQPEFAIAPI